MKKNLLIIVVAIFMLVSMTSCASLFSGSKKSTKKTKTAQTTTASNEETLQVKNYGREFGQIYLDNANDCNKLAAQLNAFLDANEEAMLNDARTIVKAGYSSSEAFELLLQMPDSVEAQRSEISNNCLISEIEEGPYSAVSRRMAEFATKFDDLDAASSNTSSNSNVDMKQIISGKWTEQVSEGPTIVYNFMADGTCTKESVMGNNKCTYTLSQENNEYFLNLVIDDVLDPIKEKRKVEYKDPFLYIYTDNYPYKYRRD